MDSLGSTPGGASILITSAPKSARMRQQVGPARTRLRSSTRRCDNALDAIGLVMVSSTLPPLIPAKAETQHVITDSRHGPVLLVPRWSFRGAAKRRARNP